MNGFQIVEIVVHDVHANAKVEARVPAGDNFEVAELKNPQDFALFVYKLNLNKVGVLCVSHSHNRVNLLNQLLLLVVVKVHVPFCESGLACKELYDF